MNRLLEKLVPQPYFQYKSLQEMNLEGFFYNMLRIFY